MDLIFSNFSFEFVTMAPPSPVVKTLFPQKLKIELSEIEPIFDLLTLEPRLSAASSIILSVFFLTKKNHQNFYKI